MGMVLAYPVSLHAQNLSGVVKDVFNRSPIANAYVITPKVTVLTNSKGQFTLSNMKVGDRLAVRIMGYETSEMVIRQLTDTLLVYLNKKSYDEFQEVKL